MIQKLPQGIAWNSSDKHSVLYRGNCLDVMDLMVKSNPDGCFDMIFADPPYNLSNGGITCQSGMMVPVSKGKWDQSKGLTADHDFTLAWLERCQKLLKPDGTLWVSGTLHVIYSIGYAMQQLGFKLLNDIVWEKPNPPPNLACRYFTHSTEIIIWAAKNSKSKHCFNYNDMKEQNGGKQMKSVWRMTSPKMSEKMYGRHPTQKPVELVYRCIEASTVKGGMVFDPFAGSSTTGVAALTLGRKYIGVEFDSAYVDLSIRRLSGLCSNLGEVNGA
jgi:site-specific DNA-methyltransferase (adenine-specific)